MILKHKALVFITLGRLKCKHKANRQADFKLRRVLSFNKSPSRPLQKSSEKTIALFLSQHVQALPLCKRAFSLKALFKEKDDSIINLRFSNLFNQIKRQFHRKDELTLYNSSKQLEIRSIQNSNVITPFSNSE